MAPAEAGGRHAIWPNIIMRSMRIGTPCPAPRPEPDAGPPAHVLLRPGSVLARLLRPRLHWRQLAWPSRGCEPVGSGLHF